MKKTWKLDNSNFLVLKWEPTPKLLLGIWLYSASLYAKRNIFQYLVPNHLPWAKIIDCILCIQKLHVGSGAMLLFGWTQLCNLASCTPPPKRHPHLAPPSLHHRTSFWVHLTCSLDIGRNHSPSTKWWSIYASLSLGVFVLCLCISLLGSLYVVGYLRFKTWNFHYLLKAINNNLCKRFKVPLISTFINVNEQYFHWIWTRIDMKSNN